MKGVTRGRGGCCGGIEISIHTPVKGVTDEFRERPDLTPISIHTPVKGVTL